VVWGSGVAARAQAPPGSVPHGAYFSMGVAQAEPPEGFTVFNPNLSPYWIGVECYPASETLHAQLDLPEGQGLVVEQVLPESPGAKAGVKRHDILLTAGDQPLRDVNNLIAAIDAAKDKEVSIKAIRGGKPLTLAVKPAKRPEVAGPVIAPFPGGDMKAIQQWLEQVKPGEGKNPLQFRIFQPGVVMSHSAAKVVGLPEGVTVTITITKTGNEPAKITVKQDKETWETTEDKLDKLPEKVRGYVETMLGRNASVGVIYGGGAGGFSGMGGAIGGGGAGGIGGAVGGAGGTGVIEHGTQSGKVIVREIPPGGPIEKRLDEMNRKIERLQKTVDELRHAQPGQDKTPEKAEQE
jgi:membrane-associated protease RseP (regulator of RpoE activity)